MDLINQEILSNEYDSISKCTVPQKCTTRNDELIHGRCLDSMHNDRPLREGERVFAVASPTEDDKLDIKSISCLDCTAQAIYEREMPRADVVYILEGTLVPTNDQLTLSQITLLDVFQPAET